MGGEEQRTCACHEEPRAQAGGLDWGLDWWWSLVCAVRYERHIHLEVPVDEQEGAGVALSTKVLDWGCSFHPPKYKGLPHGGQAPAPTCWLAVVALSSRPPERLWAAGPTNDGAELVPC